MGPSASGVDSLFSPCLNSSPSILVIIIIGNGSNFPYQSSDTLVVAQCRGTRLGVEISILSNRQTPADPGGLFGPT